MYETWRLGCWDGAYHCCTLRCDPSFANPKSWAAVVYRRDIDGSGQTQIFRYDNSHGYSHKDNLIGGKEKQEFGGDVWTAVYQVRNEWKEHALSYKNCSSLP